MGISLWGDIAFSLLGDIAFSLRGEIAFRFRANAHFHFLFGNAFPFRAESRADRRETMGDLHGSFQFLSLKTTPFLPWIRKIPGEISEEIASESDPVLGRN